MNPFDYRAWIGRAFLHLEGALLQRAAEEAPSRVTEDFVRQGMIDGMKASKTSHANRVKSEVDVPWNRAADVANPTAQFGQGRSRQHDVGVVDGTTLVLACEVKWLKKDDAAAVMSDLWKLALTHGVSDRERDCCRTYLLFGGLRKPFQKTLGDLHKNKIPLRWSPQGKATQLPRATRIQFGSLLRKKRGFETLKGVIKRHDTYHRQPPLIWTELRCRVIARHWKTIRGSNCQLNHVSGARREAKCQDMKSEFTAVRKAINSAIAAIPGVAGFVDPMLEGPPGQWTTALRQELESLQALLLRHGHLAPSTDAEGWDERVESIQQRKSWLSSADYSAIAGDPEREAALRASAVETAELIARRFKTCRSTMRLAIWMHCAVESERRQAAKYRGARHILAALLGLIEAETGIRLDSNLLIHGMVLELGGQPRRPDLVQQYADVLRLLDEADREKGLVERLLGDMRQRSTELMNHLDPRLDGDRCDESAQQDVTVIPHCGKGWLRVTEAAERLLRDVSGLDSKRAKARVSSAASRGCFKTNGKKGLERRIDPDSFNTWRISQRDKDLEQSDAWSSGG